MPIRWILPVALCARAASGHATPKAAIPLMKARRRIAAPKAQGLCGPCFGTTQLQQGITTCGMGSDGHFAWQQSPRPNVRFGSKADIGAYTRHVRFTPKSGHWLSVLGCPLVPKADICAAANSRYSITSSARPSNGSGTARPSALAVLRLITNANLSGCCTGSSAGLVPFRMRSI